MFLMYMPTFRDTDWWRRTSASIVSCMSLSFSRCANGTISRTIWATCGIEWPTKTRTCSSLTCDNWTGIYFCSTTSVAFGSICWRTRWKPSQKHWCDGIGESPFIHLLYVHYHKIASLRWLPSYNKRDNLPVYAYSTVYHCWMIRCNWWHCDERLHYTFIATMHSCRVHCYSELRSKIPPRTEFYVDELSMRPLRIFMLRKTLFFLFCFAINGMHSQFVLDPSVCQGSGLYDFVATCLVRAVIFHLIQYARDNDDEHTQQRHKSGVKEEW